MGLWSGIKEFFGGNKNLSKVSTLKPIDRLLRTIPKPEKEEPTARFTEESLRRRATNDRELLRAYRLYEEGNVTLGAITPNQVSAAVMGGRPYAITLTLTSALTGSCECEAWKKSPNRFCKHLGAVAFVMLRRDGVSPAHLIERSVGRLRTGSLQSLPDGGWLLNPSSSFPITLYGIDRHTAQEIKLRLDEKGNDGDLDRKAHTIFPLVARSNVRCKEIEDYVREFRPQYLTHIEENKRTSKEWSTASPQDQEILLRNFREQAITAIDIQPRCDLTVLFEGEPTDFTIDDQLLDHFGYTKLRFYLRQFAGAGEQALLLPPGQWGRKKFEQLVEVGLARQGKDVSVTAALMTLTVKALRDLVTDNPPPKSWKKAQISEYIARLPDVQERIKKAIVISDLFQLRPFPEQFNHIDRQAVAASWSYTAEVVDLIVKTYEAGCPNEENEEAGIPQWTIDCDEDACPYCQRAARKPHPKQQTSPVPLHIGCECIAWS